jgi:hypothetical protein
MARLGVTRRVALPAGPAPDRGGLAMPPPAAAEDAARLPPAGLDALAARRFGEGAREEAVRWPCAAPLRARFRLARHPELPGRRAGGLCPPERQPRPAGQ